MVIKDLVIKETYQRNGEVKTAWNKVGILVDNGETQFIKLFHIPNTLISVMEKRDKPNAPNAPISPAQKALIPDDIVWKE